MRARSLENSVTTLRTTTIEALVRIRPLRIAVILTTDTSRDAFLECVELLSAVWGGRFARMIYADMYAEAPRDDLSAGIKAFLPEVVNFPLKRSRHSCTLSQSAASRNLLRSLRASLTT